MFVMSCSLFPVPWWSEHLGQHDGSWWLDTLQPAALQSMPSRQRLGVLNAAHDLLKHLGHKLKPFLPEMCALVLILLEGSALLPAAQVTFEPLSSLSITACGVCMVEHQALFTCLQQSAPED